MLTRFVRTQLVIFTIASLVGLTVMVFNYLQAPTLLGLGRITVTVELPATGGLYRFSNVTYRGVQVGKVTAIDLTHTGAKATLSLANSPKIPADLHADVRSISAVGEQYLDLQPRDDAPPYLHDGSTIAMTETALPQEVGPLLDQTSALITSIPKEKLGQLLDESFRAFNGAGYDLSSLADSSAKLSAALNGVANPSRDLIQDSVPLLDSQADTTDALRTWTHSLAGITGQLVTNDPQLRTVIAPGPGRQMKRRGCSHSSNPRCPCCWPTCLRWARSWSPTGPASSKYLCCSRRFWPTCSPKPATTTPPASGKATSRSTRVTPHRAPSDFCRPTNGDPRPTPPSSTRRTTSTANCPRIRR